MDIVQLTVTKDPPGVRPFEQFDPTNPILKMSITRSTKLKLTNLCRWRGRFRFSRRSLGMVLTMTAVPPSTAAFLVIEADFFGARILFKALAKLVDCLLQYHEQGDVTKRGEFYTLGHCRVSREEA